MTLFSMLRHAVTVVGARFLGAALGLVTQLVLARQFSTAQVGQVFLAISVISLLGLFVSTGYPALAFSKFPQLAARRNTRAIASGHAAFLRDTSAVWLLTCAASYAAARSGLVDADMALALFFACLAALPSSLVRYNSAIANGLKQFNLSYLPDFIVRPALFLGFILLAFAFDMRLDVKAVLWGFVAMIVVIAAGQALLLRPDGVTPAHWKDARAAHTKRLRPRAWALLVVAAVATAYADVVTLIAGVFLTADDVARAGVAIRLAAIAAFIIQATQQFILPDLARSLHEKNHATTQSLLLRMNGVSLATMLAALAGAALFGNFVLSIFGTDYIAAYSVLLLFLVAQTIRAMSGMNQQLLALGGKQLHTAAACLTSLIIMFLAATVCCANWGLIGLGYAVIIAEIAWYIYLAILAQTHTGRRGDLLGLNQIL
jgi:O-antigen/teichoic acid export membrane protein